MKIHAIVTGAALLFSASTVFAQSAALDDAVEMWLNGPEAASLETLSDLARGGETGAQLLLGQIDRDVVPGGYSEFVASLDDVERDLLLRAGEPGESVNWLLSLSDPELADLGNAIFSYRVGRDPIGNALALQKNGEPAAAENVVWNTLNNGRFDLVNSIPEQNYGLSDAGFLQWIKKYMASPNKALTMNRLLDDPSPQKVMGLLAVKRLARVLNLNKYFSDEIDQFITILLGKGYDLPEDTNLVKLSADIEKIADLDGPLSIVERACKRWETEHIDYGCVIQALEIVNGYKTVMSIRTPSENVIPADEFLASERAVDIFENLVKSRSKYYKRPIRSSTLQRLLSGEG